MELDTHTGHQDDLYGSHLKRIKRDTVVNGKVIQIMDEGVIVDICYKCDGFIPAAELLEKERDRLKKGDVVSVYVVDTDVMEGFITLSRKRAESIKTWKMLEEAFKKGDNIKGRITEKVKGGMMVDINGLKAFLPGSHIDITPLKNTDHLIGHTSFFKVLKLNDANSNIILSRRLFLEEERNDLRERTLKGIKEGAMVKGTVKNITDYGVFIDIGGVDGLLHISDMSWGKVSHPAELFSIGDRVEVVVLTFNPDSGRVTLGYKQKTPDPWSLVEERYKIGQRVVGKVSGIVDYGVFLELESGVEGLVHISEIEWTEKVKKPSRYFAIGDRVEAMVLSINKDERKIALSIKRLKQNPWDIVKERYRTGDRITGKVSKIIDSGAFISLKEGVDAFLHKSDISWLKRINHPSEVLKNGETVEAVITNLEPDKERISVSIKRLTPDPWLSEIPNRYKLGDKVRCRIMKMDERCIIVEVDDGIDGIIYTSESGGDINKEDLKAGVDITARIVNIDNPRRRLCLSLEYC